MPRKPELKPAWPAVSATPETELRVQAIPLLIVTYRQIPAKPFNCFNLQQKRAGQIPDSTNWSCTACSTAQFQLSPGGGQDAFIVKIGNLSGSQYPMTYFTYLGGAGNDIGHDIKVDSVQAVHVRSAER